MVMHTFDPNTWEAEEGSSLGVQGQPGLHRELQGSQGETVPQNKRKYFQKEDVKRE